MLTKIDDLLEEALEDVNAQLLPNAREARMVGQWLIQRVAEIPAVDEIERGSRNELALRADALKEHDELELEEDHRVDAWPASVRVDYQHPLSDKAQVKRRFEMMVEVARGNEFLKRDRDRRIKVAGLGGPSIDGLRSIERSDDGRASLQTAQQSATA